jgi:bifunctional DNA-binding transcriptional regulator/antitoxin component of YhaV-PrlF toxin-antitoxin module
MPFSGMRKRRSKPKKPTGLSEDSAPLEGAAPAVQQVVELGAGGRLVIPAPMREALGMKVGDRLTARLDGRQLRIYTFEEGLRQAREIIGKYLPPGVDPVEDFLQWKRKQAALEKDKMEKWSGDD